jgi:hypothetical protein
LPYCFFSFLISHSIVQRASAVEKKKEEGRRRKEKKKFEQLAPCHFLSAVIPTFSRYHATWQLQRSLLDQATAGTITFVFIV